LTTVIFSHGQESGPWGTKIRAMSKCVADLGCEFDSIDYQGMTDPAARVRKLERECAHIQDKLVLVGSSMGGHVATVAAGTLGAVGLFVLAPAYYVKGYEALTPEPAAIPTCIVHGWHDDIVPVENSIRFASKCAATLHVVNGGHRLTENLDEINEYLVQFIKTIY